MWKLSLQFVKFWSKFKFNFFQVISFIDITKLSSFSINALYKRILKVGASKRALDFDFFPNVVVRNGIIEFQNLKLLSARLNKKYVCTWDIFSYKIDHTWPCGFDFEETILSSEFFCQRDNDSGTTHTRSRTRNSSLVRNFASDGCSLSKGTHHKLQTFWHIFH